MFKAIKSIFNQFYEELTIVHETPHRVGLSFALGVFLGILPFTGVLAAIAAAWFLRLNKAAAIFGSLLTNTWMGFIVLGISVQWGINILGGDWNSLLLKVKALWKNFSFQALWHADFLPLFIVVVVGYIVISGMIAVASYFLVRILIAGHRRRT